MTPADQLTARMGAEAFTAALSACLSDGYVRSEPGFFFMGRAVPSSAKDSDILDFSHTFHGEQCDAWFVCGMAGNMRLAFDALPYPLPFMIFQRDNGPFRRYKLESLTAKINGKQT